MEWAAAWPERTWAVEGARGLGHLLAQQLVAAGERVLDVQPKLAARVRLLASGDTNKNDPNDARSAAIAALRSAGCTRCCATWFPAASGRRSPRLTRPASSRPSSRPGPWPWPAGNWPGTSWRTCAALTPR